MKLKKYITAAVIVLAVAVIVGFGQVARENLTPPKVLIAEVGEGDAFMKFNIPPGGVIKEITFASYGNPYKGSDGLPRRGTCHGDTWIKRECEGRSECGVKAHNHWWGDPCPGTYKKLMVG